MALEANQKNICKRLMRGNLRSDESLLLGGVDDVDDNVDDDDDDGVIAYMGTGRTENRTVMPSMMAFVWGSDACTCNLMQVASAIVSEALQLGVVFYVVQRLTGKYQSFEMPR